MVTYEETLTALSEVPYCPGWTDPPPSHKVACITDGLAEGTQKKEEQQQGSDGQ